MVVASLAHLARRSCSVKRFSTFVSSITRSMNLCHMLSHPCDSPVSEMIRAVESCFFRFICAGQFRFRKFQCHVQRIHELVDLDRFGEITEESCLQTILDIAGPVSYTHLRAHETRHDLVCRL